jgi:GT2 family glycosyltransferase
MQEAIKSQLNLIKKSKVWRLAEPLRWFFSFKLSAIFTLLQRGMLTIRREGLGSFFNKAVAYLKRNKHSFYLGTMGSDYKRWVKKTSLTKERIDKINEEIAKFNYQAKISIIMPVYNVEQIWLEKAIDSVSNQLYNNLELCIVDDASTKKHIRETLKKYSGKDSRIKIKYLKKNRGIAGASNEALALATGEFVGLLDNDDELTVDALYECVKLLNRHPEADLIYSDEDKINAIGKRTEPFFKPDYSPDLLLAMNYICHFCMFRKSIVDDIRGFKVGYEGSQDYDLILRFIEKTNPERIFHIPKILYHWRKLPGSAASAIEAKSYSFVSAKKALSDYLERNEIDGEVLDGKLPGKYRVRRKIVDNYKVSIIIPFRDKYEALKTCVNSILEKTKYKDYEIVLVNNQSEHEKTFEYLDNIRGNPIIKIVDYDKPFNYPAINNYAVSQINCEYFVLLNNDTEVISPDWLKAMLEFAQRKDVGVVGALLYYPNDTIQHAGTIVGIGGVAAHTHKHFQKESAGYFGRIKTVQNLSAVTAACMMTKKSIFKEVDGFDTNLSHAFNDVDYCLKIRKRGYLVVYTPYAELYHHESLSRGYEDSPVKRERFRNEIEYFQASWKGFLTKGDPYYNPNLSLERDDFTIKV